MYKIDQTRVRNNTHVDYTTPPTARRASLTANVIDSKLATVLNDHETIKSDIYKLRSQLYEVCQQAQGTDVGLCERIKSSNRTPGVSYQHAIRRPIVKTNDSSAAVLLDVNRSSPAAVASGQRALYNGDRSGGSLLPVNVDPVVY
ncbi:hypothetical protein [Orgyia pseudotsugata single capsid nuclopolyhedrovirus]|nr:hypothetical protein [Orgyia pseudotsugata single capsid nuclopolyhedrovirus]